jgi:cob(I)alamin adenosyltransferase
MIKSSEGRSTASLAATRRTLSEHLRARLGEIEEAIFARVRAVSEPDRAVDPEYLKGMRAAVTEAVEYSIEGIEGGVAPNAPVPTAAIVQARRSARAEIPLDTVLRRYAAGDRLLAEFITEVADEVPREALRETLRAQGARVDHIMATIASEYEREAERIRRSPAQRLGERVRRLVAGEADSDPGIAYHLDSWHVGMVVIGAEAEAAVVRFATTLKAEVLVIPADDEVGSIWAWVGRRRRLPMSDVSSFWADEDVSVALGEPRRGVEGWRLTHHEAQAALQVLLLGSERLVRSRDALVVAALLRDDALAAGLIGTYLAPLRGRGDMEAVLRETIRAYFNAGQNAATAAAVLQVNRHTVERRIRSIEDKLGQQINVCRVQLEVALAIEELRRG